MLQTLWLTSWYPSKTSSQNGDFIQRHAQATSLFADIYVLYVVPNHDILSAKEIVFNQSKNLAEEIVYYKKKNENLWSNFFSVIKYFRLYKKHIKKYIRQYGKPDIVHVHVAMRAGILALWLKRKYYIPYIVTEHWTGYTEEDPENIYTKSFLFRHYAKRIFKHASNVLPVSNHLGKNIQKMVIDVPFIKVPNVVSDAFYFANNDRRNKPFTFIHVSSLNELKNPKGIINAFAGLLKERKNVVLKIVGFNFEPVKKYAIEKGIGAENIIFTGEISNDDVANEMRESDAFVLFSNSETFGCVIAESLVCGNPVISTNVCGISETINPANGILIAPKDEQALVNAMKFLMDNYSLYDSEKISTEAKRQFNYDVVGKKILNIYEQVL